MIKILSKESLKCCCSKWTTLDSMVQVAGVRVGRGNVAVPGRLHWIRWSGCQVAGEGRVKIQIMGAQEIPSKGEKGLGSPHPGTRVEVGLDSNFHSITYKLGEMIELTKSWISI